MRLASEIRRAQNTVGILPASLLCLCIGYLQGCGYRSAEVETQPAIQTGRYFIIGQDLNAIRGYINSQCCTNADATTAYISFYNLMREDLGYGGLGIDETGTPVELEWEWGAGPVNAYKSGKEFGIESLAIGVSFAENEHPGALDRLVAGDYDANIKQLAAFAKLFSGPVYLRLGYEFDGMWNQGYEDAPGYIRAWKRIVDGVRDAGANNVEFVWQASASRVDDILDSRHEDITRWYPGDDYVDWMAFSMFAHPDGPALVEMSYAPATPRTLIDEVLAFARQRDKPVMIAEAAPRTFNLEEMHRSNHIGIYDGPAGQDRKSVSADQTWDAFFGPLFDLMTTNSDVIRALAYINVDWDQQPMWGPPFESGYWGDTRLEVNEALGSRFSAAVDEWRGLP